MRSVAVLVAVLAAGCGGERPFDPGRSVRLELQVAGLPDGSSAEYRVFVQDTVAIAHGMVANGETDTVLISSSAALRVHWQDALLPVGEASYIFRPGEREVLVEESDSDTTVALATWYALASGGFILNAPGVPVQPWAEWRAWNQDDSVVAAGPLRAGEVVRRGDLPPGSTRLKLDTIQVELDGVLHAYAPPQQFVPLSITASLALIPVDAPYALVSAAVRVRASGLPAGTLAPWGMTTVAGDFSAGGQAEADTFQTAGLLRAGSYNLEWGEVTVEGVAYRPNPATQPATLEPSLVPYEFETVYAAVP
ncbi:MAG: hypothetical protein ACXWWN_07855 [Gemmatimonadales bacterium]